MKQEYNSGLYTVRYSSVSISGVVAVILKRHFRKSKACAKSSSNPYVKAGVRSDVTSGSRAGARRVLAMRIPDVY